MCFRICVLTATLVLAGCASVGKEVTQDQLAGFKEGVTTSNDVVAKLGEPTGRSVMSNGVLVMTYTFAHAQARPASFVPIIGPLIGGADSRSSFVTFTFGADGKLQRYSASSSQSGMGTGLAGGSYQAATPDQPSEAPKK